MFFNGSNVGVRAEEDVFELGFFLVGLLDGFFAGGSGGGFRWRDVGIVAGG